MRKRGAHKLKSEGLGDWGRRRVEADLSLRDLGELTGINRGLLSMLDRGQFIPSPAQSQRLLDAYANGKARLAD